jgi:hypothetical protein
MADEQPSLHIDTDWKKQAQEEKRRLAEEEQKRAAASKPPEPESLGVPPGVGATKPAASGPGASASAAAPRGRSGAGAGGRERGAAPDASFATLVQSLATQVLFYLGDLAPRGSEPQVNLDMAKYNVELLNILEQKTKNNLSDEEQRLLDGALYETRMRFVSVASQYATV